MFDKLLHALYLFFMFCLPYYGYGNTCDSCPDTPSFQNHAVDTEPSGKSKCIRMSRTKIYDQTTPLFAEYGCRNKFKVKLMLLNMVRSPLVVGSVIVSELKSDPTNEAMYYIMFPLIGMGVSAPIGFAKGLVKAAVYELIYKSKPNNFKVRPRIGYSFSPAFSKLYAVSGTLFYRHFNCVLGLPDVYEIGYSFREYTDRYESINGQWYECITRNFFIGSEWRLTNRRFFNVYGGLRAGFSTGDFYRNTSLTNVLPINTPLVDLGCRYELNALDVFTISLSTNYQFAGPVLDIKKYTNQVAFKDHMSINISLGGFIF